jgi:hypothetical protein
VSLEPGPFRSGAIAGLSDGGALALRRGEESWELVRALPGGSVGWRRRLDRSEVQPPALLLAGGVPYVVTRGGNVLAVDTGSGNATLVYRAGRTVARARASSAGDRIVLEAGGAYSIAMDPRGTRPPAVLD